MKYDENPITKTSTTHRKIRNIVVVASAHAHDEQFVDGYSNAKRYLLFCKSCHWHTQYISQSGNQLDISDSIGICPICRIKSVKSSVIPFSANIVIQ